MKLVIVMTFVLSTLLCFSQEKEIKEARPIGIGFRIADFNGISIKYYLENAGICLEANVGRSYFSGDNYEKRFEEYATESGVVYVGYDEKKTLELGSFGYRLDIQKYGEIGRTPHFYWYVGTGLQARTFELEHSYSYDVSAANSTAIRVNDDGKEKMKHRSYGVDFIVGGEYVFQELPLAVFVEGLMFYEAFELSGNVIAQFGLGARFQF